MKKQETRSEREKRRYDAVMRALYHDPRQSEKARQARGWSDKRIKETYGVDSTKRLRYSEKPSRSTVWRSRKRLISYLRNKPSQLTPVKRTKKIGIGITMKDATKSQKIALWQRWGTKKNFPKWARDTAKEINLKYAGKKGFEQAKFDEGSDYGWVVTHWGFILDQDTEIIEQMYKPSQFDADVYMDLAVRAAPRNF